MDFSASADLIAIEEEATRLAAAFDDDYWLERDEKKEFPWAFYNAFAEPGWLGTERMN